MCIVHYPCLGLCSIMFAFETIPDFICVVYETETEVFPNKEPKPNRIWKIQNRNNTTSFTGISLHSSVHTALLLLVFALSVKSLLQNLFYCSQLSLSDESVYLPSTILVEYAELRLLGASSVLQKCAGFSVSAYRYPFY